MARRRREVKTSGDDYRRRPLNSLADKPKLQFFKIILPCTLTDKKLMIPPKFARRFGDELSDVANFILADGSNWKVAMQKDQNDIWFDDGWHDFVEHHSIDIGYFVIFAYRGFSNFSVVIFDRTACEIEHTENARSPLDGKEKDVLNEKDEIEPEKTSLENGKAMQAWKNFKTEMPCFKILIQQYQFDHSIAEENLRRKSAHPQKTWR
ncbi:B3 domain-containing protein At4g01580-like isoform X2 [Mercurialis annua]|uniref:B3 domain-containing protein At4g01580-like isoform X2 n=1 Tax=Mercurialis annua TaxID=3986 RepID=UPI0021606E37|nr:B3 domain-containing protein At4g01580-like isoform X2 [Mercurialis annua]